MRTIRKTIDSVPDLRPVSGSPEELMIFDIETTGLSARNHSVFLIGCIIFSPDGKSGELVQFFAESPEEESFILFEFCTLAANRHTLVHYNGQKFDLPFLREHALRCGMPDPFTAMRSVDIYRTVARFRNLLGLIDGKQQTAEAFLGTGRTENTSGRDVAVMHSSWMKDRNPRFLEAILAHNEADLRGVMSLIPLLSYDTLQEELPVVYRAEASTYTDYLGEARDEVILRFRFRTPVPRPVFGSRDACFFKAESGRDGTEGIVKIPLFSGELKYFYADYHDYYYFPEQDQALHKSVAVYADRTHRLPARPDNCYTRKNGAFLPEWDLFRTPFYKKDYQSAALFFELTPEVKTSRRLLSEYAAYIIRHIIDGCR